MFLWLRSLHFDIEPFLVLWCDWLAVRGSGQWPESDRVWEQAKTKGYRQIKVTNTACDLYWYSYQRFTVTTVSTDCSSGSEVRSTQGPKISFLTPTPSIVERELRCEFSALAPSKSRICRGDRSVLVQIKYLSFQEFKILQWTNLVRLQRYFCLWVHLVLSTEVTQRWLP